MISRPDDSHNWKLWLTDLLCILNSAITGLVGSNTFHRMVYFKNVYLPILAIVPPVNNTH